MLRYDLDKLGWYEFEGLVQSLLKAQLGLGVEAWGGSKDYGRDAYFRGSLHYPTKIEREGPFLFQCKFVDGANAAGSKPSPLIIEAVRSECAEIKKRGWPKSPTVYTLFTNAKLSPTTRKEIARLISQVLPHVEVITQGGPDICALLDMTPHVARAYPQFLGLRNLQDLLRERINADILARSESAITEARELANVFVPTTAYYKALDKLNTYHFVVLEGMPEMGKTAIGRVIALAKLNEGWVARECRRPDDFLREYKLEEKQIFLADDFFGRTEYDPTRVSQWQDDFPGIYRHLNANHWLIFTSRIHLLKLAGQTLDVNGLNEVFPHLGEVTVDAGLLSEEEKARILYRHAKNAGLAAPVKGLVKIQAASITRNEYYTPERIRRLIHEWLPREIEPHIGMLSPNDLGNLIRANLQDPTKGMRVTFGQLPAAHKWLLFALVEGGLDGKSETTALQRRYEAICPASNREPFAAVVEQLSEAFVNKFQVNAETVVKWIHPSAMDLVIEEFARSEQLRRHYLAHCDAQGIQLATSVGGGARGGREVPLLVTEDDWEICARRSIELLKGGKELLRILLSNYIALLRAEQTHGTRSPAREDFERLLFGQVLQAVYSMSGEDYFEWTTQGLEQFYQARELSPNYVPTVDPSLLFFTKARDANKSLQGNSLDPSGFEDFEQLISLLERYDPSFLRNPKVKEVLLEFIERLRSMGEDESSIVDFEFDDEDIDEMEKEIKKLEGLSGIYQSLSQLPLLPEETVKQFSTYASVFETQASDLADTASEIRERIGPHDPPDDYDYGRYGGTEVFSIDKLFSDL